jgi:Fe-S-cluster containining protein
MSKKWKCQKCGECCKHISIYAANIGWEEVAYLEAHGCKYIDGHIIIPARCAYLTPGGLCARCAYLTPGGLCAIHKTKFGMCKKYGENECLLNKKC